MRCIDADKLIMKDLGDGNYLVTRDSIINAPTFEAEPMRVGHWKQGYITNDDNSITQIDYDCSVCGMSNDIKTNYCPNCGAKMK